MLRLPGLLQAKAHFCTAAETVTMLKRVSEVNGRGARVAQSLANPSYPPHLRFPVGIGDDSVEIS
jgi:hypothetical protein